MISDLILFFRINCKSSSFNGFNFNVLQRDKRGLITSKDGFSVVAPIKTMIPPSIA